MCYGFVCQAIQQKILQVPGGEDTCLCGKTLPPEQAVALIIQLPLPFQWNGCFEVFPPHKSVRATTRRHVLTEGMRDRVAKSAARGPLPGCIKISDEGVRVLVAVQRSS